MSCKTVNLAEDQTQIRVFSGAHLGYRMLHRDIFSRTGGIVTDEPWAANGKEDELKRFETRWCVLPALILGATSAFAAPADPYKITAREKAACTTDAMRFCAYTYPDAGQLLSCMKSNRTSLSAVCLAAFDAGMKRRHLD